MKKNIHFILQDQQNIGKSIFSYLIANLVIKNKKKIIFVNISNSEKNKGKKYFNQHYNIHKIDDFFRFLTKLDDSSIIICDFDSINSNRFLNSITSEFYVKYKTINFNIYTIIGGDHLFEDSCEYCVNLFEKCPSLSKNVIVNNIYSFSEEQKIKLSILENKLKIIVKNLDDLTSNLSYKNFNEIFKNGYFFMGNGRNSEIVIKSFTKIRFNRILDDLGINF